MNRFVLQRLEDETGISGEGFVAEGVQFSDGKCVLTWLTEFSSVAIYDSIDLVDKIHGHNGKTVIHWIDKEIVGLHFGDPCVYCNVGHDDVEVGPCPGPKVKSYEVTK